jgi:hypothetical protein
VEGQVKRVAGLFDQIIACENMELAFERASLGKRRRADVVAFRERLSNNLRRLSIEVCDGTARLGRCNQFVIHDPKRRVITAPCFEERVLHHAIMNICEPVFDRWLIADSYACRRGKGRIAALRRAQGYSRCHSWFLKLDIRQYFDSIPHARLLRRLQRLFKDRPLLELLERIIRSFRGTGKLGVISLQPAIGRNASNGSETVCLGIAHEEVGTGIPIGSLTSQHFANFYLGWLDRFIKEKLRAKGYVRYMDDMLIWGDSGAELRRLLERIRLFVSDELGLQLKDSPYVNRSVHGVDFLGVRIFPSRLVLNRRSRIRFRRKLLQLECGAIRGEVTDLELQQRAGSLFEFTQAGGLASWCFRQKVLQQVAATVARLGPVHPGR